MKVRTDQVVWVTPPDETEVVEPVGSAPGLPAEADGAPPVNGAARMNGAAQTNGAVKASAKALNAPVAAPDAAVPLTALVEAVLFVADAPVAVADLARALDVAKGAVERSLAELATVCDGGRGVRLQRTNGMVQLVSAPEAAGAIECFLGLEQSTRLSRAALDTLSIIAYRQPVTRPEIDALRGVDSDGVLRTLLARGLTEVVGRRDTVGHPVEYGTTFLFLEYFGLTGLGDLPPIDLVDESALDETVDGAGPGAACQRGLPDGGPQAPDDSHG